MRINDLAKEIGKTNKEIIHILQKRGDDIKSHFSSINDEQIRFIKQKLGAGQEAKTESMTIENNKTEMNSKAVDSNEKVEKSNSGEPHKKKLTAVFRPQNAQGSKRNSNHTSKGRNLKEKNEKSKGEKKRNQNKNNGFTSKIMIQPDIKDAVKTELKNAPKQSVKKENLKQTLNTSMEEKQVVEKIKGIENTIEIKAKIQEVEKQGIEEKSHIMDLDSKKLGDLKSLGHSKSADDLKNSDKKDSSKTMDIKERNVKKSDNLNIENLKENMVEKESLKSRNVSPEISTKLESDTKSESNIKSEEIGKTEATKSESIKKEEVQKPETPVNRIGQITRNVFDNFPPKTTENTTRTANRSNERNRGKNSGDRNHQDKNNERRNQNKNTQNRNDRSRNIGDRNQDRNQDRNRNSQNQNRNFGDRNQEKNQISRNVGERNQNNRGRGNRTFGENPFDKDREITPRNNTPKQRNSNKDNVAGLGGGLVKKTSSNRLNKNQYKDQKTDKKHRFEDGPIGKGSKIIKDTFKKPEKKVEKKEEQFDIKEIILPDNITIKELAEKMKKAAADLIKKLFLKGEVVTLNTEIPFEKAEEIALDYEILCTLEEKIDATVEILKEEEELEENLLPRPPVVCVIGHIDHGKTSLLDAIRKTNVISREAGGITQHIGAYTVQINEQPITFLDTPGHEAFTSMRLRGAKSTDIAVLVVAADDGVMPQTIEAISHAKEAGLEIIVAINKIDKPGANVDRVLTELMEHSLIPERFGGTTVVCQISAKNRIGIEELLENIILTAELMELRANPNRLARGIVIEAKVDKGKGAVATVLIQKGTLHRGDYVSAGSCFGKVRAMTNDKGRRVDIAGPSTPIEIQGLDSAPQAGDILVAHKNNVDAKKFANTFITDTKNKRLEETMTKLSLEDLVTKIKEGQLKELPLIIKADVQGSVEALKQSLLKQSNDEVQVRVVHGAVGSINESDISLAAASNAIIIGFNVRPDVNAVDTIEREKVDVRLYKVIYDVINDIESALRGMLAPVYEEKVIGHAEIRKVYKASGVGSIAGSYILDGKFQRGCKVRITRDGSQIFEGNLASLKRFQDDVKEVATGYECGLSFEKFNDIQEMDLIEAYIMVEVPRK